jgi:hypothetical protein
MDKVLVFIFGVALGVLLIIYREKLQQITGDIDFAERYLGSGGTFTLYILVGLGAIILSVMYAFGTLQLIAGSSLGMFF